MIKISSRISGNRILIAGSVDDNIELSTLEKLHVIVKLLIQKTIENGGGLVLTVGNNPMHKLDHQLPLIFDWTIVDALVNFTGVQNTSWSKEKGAPFIIVVYPNWEEKVPTDKKDILNQLLGLESIQLIKIHKGIGVGGVLREIESDYGDILITIGGERGVNHLEELFRKKGKPVIPLNAPTLSQWRNASEILYDEAMEYPERFFELKSPYQSTAFLQGLSLKSNPDDLTSVNYVEKLISFINCLENPVVFYVRLLDSHNNEHQNVEWFFRTIVDPVIESKNFTRFEASTDGSSIPLLNVEIFNKIKYCSILIADLTGLRQNCFLELGIALGLGKKCIITAKEGTSLTFDTHAFPCFFWKKGQVKTLREIFGEFFKKSEKRIPLMKGITILQQPCKLSC